LLGGGGGAAIGQRLCRGHCRLWESLSNSPTRVATSIVVGDEVEAELTHKMRMRFTPLPGVSKMSRLLNGGWRVGCPKKIQSQE
jgi:hypothetical protein